MLKIFPLSAFLRLTESEKMKTELETIIPKKAIEIRNSWKDTEKLKPFNKENMDFLAELYDAGKVVPVIDKQISLNEVPEGVKYLEDGLALGKLVITMV